jgi:hypothetical protein
LIWDLLFCSYLAQYKGPVLATSEHGSTLCFRRIGPTANFLSTWFSFSRRTLF